MFGMSVLAVGANAQTVSTAPNPPVRGQQCVITYDATGRNLSNASQVKIHTGYNGWTNVILPNPNMTSIGNKKWTYTFTVNSSATVLDMVFNNGSGTWDNNSGQDWHINTVAPSTPPVAAFSGSPTSGVAPLTVNFSDSSTGSPTSWAWDFDNNGSTDSTSKNPSHTYTTPGTYSVKLTATNSVGSDPETKTAYISVAAPAPAIATSTSTINATGSQGTNATSRSFTVSNSGTGTLNYTIAKVDTGDGTGWFNVSPASGSSTGENDTINVTFASSALAQGTYDATIRVSGNSANSPQNIALSLAVTESTPTTTTVIPNPPTAGSVARVWYKASGGPLNGASQVNLHWGINTWTNVQSSAMTSASGGMWYVDLNLPTSATKLDFVTNNGAGTWDNNGGSDWHYNVNPPSTSPTAAFSASTVSGTAPLTVNFFDDSTGGPTGWAWDFDNNGTTDSTTQNASHTYSTAGTYSVKLTATNAFGSDSLTKTNYITVSNAVPSLSLNKTTMNATTAQGSSPSSQTFTVTNSGTGTLNYTVAKVDTGDGTSWFSVNPTSGSSTGEADTITVSFSTASLAQGTYDASIQVAGNATNSPRTIALSVAVTESTPTTTTVVPNPPTAGQVARVWYKASGGPLASASAINLYWGVNTWTGVTSTAMTQSTTAGMWYKDITLPSNATVLDFVTNNGGSIWDNNGGADWHFTVQPGAPEPAVALSTTNINATATVGSNADSKTFTIANSGTGTLNYTLTKLNTGDGTSWFNVSPTSGSSTGEADTITVSFNSSSLGEGLYLASIEADGNADNAPQSLTVSLNVTPASTVPPITIGAGPVIGTNTEGTTYREEFQDWVASDVRGLDLPEDAATLGDAAYVGSRDIMALYSRFENDNLFLRVDFYELGTGAESGHCDVYVLIDCASGGITSMPDGISGATTATGWDLAVKTYDSANYAVQRSNGSTIAGAHLGAYWRGDLDSVEFGVRQSALTAAGWNGSSPVNFYVMTSRDMSGQIADTSNFSVPMSSEGVTGTAKFASIAHGNQSLNRGDSMRDRMYISAANTGTGAPSGFRLALDTHSIFQIPLNIHMSSTLISAIGWIHDSNPVWNGQDFLAKVGSMVDPDQSNDPGALIGGVFAEHIMPFFNGPINQNSIDHFDDMVQDIWGLTPADMRVMHTPERVINSVAAASGLDPFDDIAASAYTATYLDEVSHIRNWLYPSEIWTGINGDYGVPHQHKIQYINGVYCFQINDNEDQYKFWQQDSGAHTLWRRYLLYKAMDTDQAQLTLIFDDWEAIAGYSFGSGYNDNALNYNNTMRWVANHQWIEVVTLAEIMDRATNAGNPKFDPDWIINQGEIGNKPFDTYDYLQHATEDSYANWYWGNSTEESFRNAVPVVTGVIGSGTTMPSGKIFGDIGTTGTIIRDTWDAVVAAPQNSLRELAEKGYQAMIYETAWHDEDNTGYERTASSNYHNWAHPDTTWDPVSNWAYVLHNHLRDVTITTTAASWVNAVKNGTAPSGVVVQSLDLDQDGQNEYVLSNRRVWMAFEARGGRCVQAYAYDTVNQDGISILGTSPINNPTAQGEEEGTTTASRCSAFKDMNGSYADQVYNVSTGSSSITFSSGQVSKTFSLSSGTTTTVNVSYTNNTGSNLYTRLGVSVNNLDLLHHGQNFVSTYSSSSFTQQNNTRGRLTVNNISNGSINQLDTFTKFIIPLTEQMEVRLGPGSSSFQLQTAP